MFNSQKFVLISAAALALMVAAWASYYLGYDQGKKSVATSTQSSNLVTNLATDSAGTLYGVDRLFALTFDATHGAAVGQVTAVADNSVTIAYKGESATFALDDKVGYFAGKPADKSSLKVGSQVTIRYEKKPDGSYLATSVDITS